MQATAKIRQLARRARAKTPTREAEEFLLREIFEQAATNCMLTEHVSTLILVLSMLAVGDPLPGVARAHVERDGETGENVLKFDSQFGLFGRVEGERGVGNLVTLLGHLQANGWVKVARSGPEITVRLGARAKRVLGVSKP